MTTNNRIHKTLVLFNQKNKLDLEVTLVDQTIFTQLKKLVIN